MGDTSGLWQHEDMPCGERWRTPEREDWYCEVWHTPGVGYRYAFRCMHTTPDPKMPEAEWFLHCHGSGGPSATTYSTPQEAIVACEEQIAKKRE